MNVLLGAPVPKKLSPYGISHGLTPRQNMRSEGLEPPTYKFVACCSIQLSYDRMFRCRIRDLAWYSAGFTFPAACASEREGFEPSIRCYPYNGLANRRLQPLGHLSTAAWGVLSTGARTLVHRAGKNPQRPASKRVLT